MSTALHRPDPTPMILAALFAAAGLVLMTMSLITHAQVRQVDDSAYVVPAGEPPVIDAVVEKQQ